MYLLRLDRVAGLMVDDAWYLLLAQALANGDGFRLVGSAETPILPAVPPGFPAIIAGVFRIAPRFPQNILLIKAVSIAAMAGFGVATYWYCARSRRVGREIAVCIAAATVLTPAFVFLATSTVMAECVFALLQLAAVIVLDRAAGAPRDGPLPRGIVSAAILTVAAMLVRTAGVALLAAGGLYVLLWHGWRRACLFAGVACVCLAPWMLYARVHAPTAAQRTAQGASIAYAYSDLMRMRGAGNAESGRVTIADVAPRVAANLVNIACRDMGGIVVPVLFRGARESGEEVLSLGGALGLNAGSMGSARGTMIVSLVLVVVALVGYIGAARERVTAAEVLVPVSLAVIVLVPVWTYRYVLPLAPFLLLYLVRGLDVMMRWLARGAGPVADGTPPAAVRVLVLCVIALHLLDHAQYIYAARHTAEGQTTDWLDDAREVDEVLDWMKQHLTGPGYVASTNPALVYLATGRRTVGMDDLSNKWDGWKRGGVRYLVSLRPHELPPASKSYQILYQTARHRLWIVAL